MRHKNPGTMLLTLGAFEDGLTSHLPQGVTQLSLDGVQMAVADVIVVVREFHGVYEAVPNNHSAWKKSVEVRKDKAPTAEKFVGDLQRALEGVLGKTNEDLRYFGLEPQKERPKPTAEQLAERAAKMRATRKARGTMGPRQRAKIHGQVTKPGNDAQSNSNAKT